MFFAWQLIAPARGKSNDELNEMKALIPDSMGFVRPFLRPLSQIDEEHLVPIIQAGLDVQSHQGQGTGALPLESVISGHTAFKAIPASARVNLVRAMRDAEEFQQYHAFAEVGAESIANLSEEQLRLLVDDYNATGSMDHTLWLKVAGQAEAHAVKSWVQEGPLGLRVLSFLGGFCMVLTGLIGFLIGLFTGEWWHMLVNVGVVVCGLVTFVVEIKTALCKVIMRKTIENEVQMLTTVEGRGWFYIFACTLCLCQWGEDDQILNLFSGWFVFFVGILNIVAGVHVSLSSSSSSYSTSWQACWPRGN